MKVVPEAPDPATFCCAKAEGETQLLSERVGLISNVVRRGEGGTAGILQPDRHGITSVPVESYRDRERVHLKF